MSEFIYQWIDFLWLPLAFFAVERQHRLYAVGFVLMCILGLRLQADLFHSIHRDGGITGWFSTSARARGTIVYAVFIMLFLILSHFSRGTRPIIYFAATLSVFIMAFVVSTLVMMV